MVRAEDPLAVGQGLLVQRDRLVQPPRRPGRRRRGCCGRSGCRGGRGRAPARSRPGSARTAADGAGGIRDLIDGNRPQPTPQQSVARSACPSTRPAERCRCPVQAVTCPTNSCIRTGCRQASSAAGPIAPGPPSRVGRPPARVRLAAAVPRVLASLAGARSRLSRPRSQVTSDHPPGAAAPGPPRTGRRLLPLPAGRGRCQRGTAGRSPPGGGGPYRPGQGLPARRSRPG